MTIFLLGLSWSEIGNGRAEGLRVIVGAMSGALLPAKRAGDMVIREGDIAAVSRIDSYLEEVRKRAAIAIGASGTAGTLGSGVHDVVAGHVLWKRRNGGVAIDAFGHVNVSEETYKARKTSRIIPKWGVHRALPIPPRPRGLN